MKTSRTAASARNAAAGMLNRGLVSLLKLVTKMIFVRRLSDALYGVSGLFGNVLGLLALADLGIGTAITYALYRPLADGDEDRVSAVMAFFKKAYRFIALGVIALGLVLLPFLPHLVKGDGVEHLRLYYLVFLGNMAIDYFFSYRRTLATAAQEAWRMVPITTAFEALIALGQIAVLLAFSAAPWCYFAFLLVQSLGLVAENLVLNRFLDRRYPVLRRPAPALPKEERQAIFKNIRALMLHKIGSVVVAGTDNLIISAMIDLVLVGYYGNYNSLIVTVSGLVYLITTGATASFGNLFAGDGEERRLAVFGEWMLASYFLYGVGSAFFLTLFPPFITLAYGERFLLSPGVVALVVAANFYLLGITTSMDVVKAAAGLYDPDKWAPLVQSVLNLGISIFLAARIGLAGVFWGTLLSTLVPLIVKPIVLYRHLFHAKPGGFFLRFVYETALAALGCGLSVFLCGLWSPDHLVLQMLWRFLVTAVVAVGLFLGGNAFFPELYALVRRALDLVKRKGGKSHA